MGSEPILGRAVAPDEDRRCDAVATLSNALWQGSFRVDGGIWSDDRSHAVDKAIQWSE